MKKLWFVIFLLLSTIAQVQADDVILSVCKLGEQQYQFSFTGDVIGWGFNNAVSYDLDSLQAQGDGVEFVAYYLDGGSESIFGDPDAPFCADSSKNDWQPGAPSIPIELTSDCAFVEIQDDYGHWVRVQSDGVDVLLHWGEALIGSVRQSTNPADYRALETECF